MDVNEIIAPPTPILKGTFAIYELPDGGRILAYRPEGEEESQQIHVPAFMMRMIEQVQAGGEMPNPMQLMRAMMSGGGM